MRASGILMPVFSLPQNGGIGTFGREAYRFADFLKRAGQSYWQVLPLNPTTYGDSPYQSFSSNAGNPYFIDLDLLAEEGLLRAEEYRDVDFGSDAGSVDYEKLYRNRFPVLRTAFSRFDRTGADFLAFCRREHAWLADYALFMALKDAGGGDSWHTWQEPLRRRKPAALRAAREEFAGDVAFYEFLQYEFYRQWYALKAYVNGLGIRIIGDLPIYVADDSVDVWANPGQFDLDENLLPNAVAGCPPDAFSRDGQLWGMPLYRWDAMREEKQPYRWWRARMRHALRVYDVVRIDHFRAFAGYYCIPYGAKNARRGKWKPGPGMDLFRCLQNDRGKKPLPIIAEDLGFLTPDVRKLLRDAGFPGMKVLQFAFNPDGKSEYLPFRYERNCVVYTGTHDNDTIIGWTKAFGAGDVEYARRYLHVDDREGFNWAMMRAALASVADTAILMMPDILGLDNEARINTPSSVGTNWKWRVAPECINDWLAGIVRENTELYGR